MEKQIIDDESLSYIIGTGSYCGPSGDRDRTAKPVAQIGFIRQKPKAKASAKTTDLAAKRAKAPETTNKRGKTRRQNK